jgi:hypothetical protein
MNAHRKRERRQFLVHHTRLRGTYKLKLINITAAYPPNETKKKNEGDLIHNNTQMLTKVWYVISVFAHAPF